MKKLCIFDFDGTLFNTIEDVAECLDKTLKIYDYPTLDLEEYTRRVGGNLYEILKNVLDDENMDSQKLENIKDTYVDIAGNHEYTKTHPYNGMYNLLKKLQDDDIILAINSNRTPESIKLYLGEYMDDIRFIDIQGHVSTNPSKPHPYGVEHILKKAKINAEDAVYIGDSSTDIQTAKNAGIEIVLVSWGYSEEEDLNDEYITSIINNPEELYEVIF